MLLLRIVIFFKVLLCTSTTRIEQSENNTIEALRTIVESLTTNWISLLIPKNCVIQDSDLLISRIQSIPIGVNVYYDTEKYIEFVESNLKNSIETISLILSDVEYIEEIQYLGHRISLFMFYWNGQRLPKFHRFFDPLRIVVITQPNPNLFKIFYNGASSNNDGRMVLVNFLEVDQSGHYLHAHPLFPPPIEVFKNLNGKLLYIPVIHCPPWYFVKYTTNSSDTFENRTEFLYDNDALNNSLEVIGGRDDNLIKLLSVKMNFVYEYIDPPERTQGSILMSSDNDNISFTGGLGMVQRREADIFLGDIALSWERKQAVEFSVFTLADSGAFATHNPRVLNEALALIRPFRLNVWPTLIVTVIIAGPLLFLNVIIPRFIDELRYNPTYIKEITINKRAKPSGESLKQILDNCVWLTLAMFLRQSAKIPYNSNRFRFLVITIWLAATYVIGDVYSAQLTSQLAQPAKEQPINTLHRLKTAMLEKGYNLFVERQSASLNILENGTGIFGDIFTIMKRRSPNNESYLVASVEEGIRLIVSDYRTAILGGRETLYFNIRKHGTNNFQLSEKLYTRYSALAVQSGCSFLENLNQNILRLYEANILEKITNNEYKRMLDSQEQDTSGARETVKESHQSSTLQPLSLKMLQGAFYVLILGYVLSGILLMYEIESKTNFCTVIRLYRKIRFWR